MHVYNAADLLASGMRPVANLILPRDVGRVLLPRGAWRDDLARENARRIRRRLAMHRCSALGTGTFSEVPPVITNCTAMTANATETSLLTGSLVQPKLAPPMLDTLAGRGVVIEGWGILSTTTGPPTITFKTYLNTTQGVATLGGTSLASTAAITTVASVSNKNWFFKLYIAVAGFGVQTSGKGPGDGSSNCTLYAGGYVSCSAGFASPYTYTLGPSGGDGATVTEALDGSQVQYFNLSGNWSSASNSIQLLHLQMTGLN